MILKKSLQKELSFITGGVFMALFSLVVTIFVIRILGNAAAGGINPKDVLVLIGLAMINQLPILLVASVFTSTLIVLTRWHKDSEMVIWQTSGISLLNILFPILKFTIPFAVIIASLSIFLSPWANEQTAVIKQRFDQRDDISMLAPGQFRESPRNNRVFFIENINTEKNVIQNIFVTNFSKDRQLVAVAKEGFIQNKSDGEKYLILENGRRYEGIPGNTDFRITEFEKYTFKIENKALEPIINAPKAISTWNLIQNRNPVNLGEIFWRIQLPLMVFSLVLIAIPLSHTDPRSSKNMGFIIAVLTYFSYSNLVKLFESWISNGKISFSIAWWLLHVLVALIGIALIFYHQNRSITLYGRYQRWAKKKTQGAA